MGARVHVRWSNWTTRRRACRRDDTMSVQPIELEEAGRHGLFAIRGHARSTRLQADELWLADTLRGKWMR